MSDGKVFPKIDVSSVHLWNADRYLLVQMCALTTTCRIIPHRASQSSPMPTTQGIPTVESIPPGKDGLFFIVFLLMADKIYFFFKYIITKKQEPKSLAEVFSYTFHSFYPWQRAPASLKLDTAEPAIRQPFSLARYTDSKGMCSAVPEE